MCLGELAEVLEAPDARTAVVRSSVRTLTVSLLTIEGPVAPGDWLLCHSGFALRRLTPQEAHEAAALRSTSPSPLAEATEEAWATEDAEPTAQKREP
ncbi:HypC/HybG/HupF family hydrogenase formation chaperone [Knoellia sp. 3-2P3]|uniref:HypC/HybG/HupF family hydrogenase formation chaperone n=1 Tax=unclassified Knoellia TaxID=2618719 RepID=UPI0023DC048A|nr:HypC/HybG/HupF family hydrogenase formation chaperone [Knoellia sp. 3-2P3]MDF2092174.1 HypC/HybG/HupF family hydrogenase formation chaperone [Knoellia sp. 3-2P3]